MATGAEGHRNISMGEGDWRTAATLAADVGGNRSEAIRMAVRYASEHPEDFLRFVLTQPNLKPGTRRAAQHALTTKKEN